MNDFEERAQSIMDEILLKMREHFGCSENSIKMHDLELRANGDLSFMFETFLIKEGSASNELIHQVNIFLEFNKSHDKVVFYDRQPYKYPENTTNLFEAIQLHLDNKRNIYVQRR